MSERRERMGPEQVAPLRQRPAWAALERHHAEIGDRHLRELFADDPDRGERLRVEAVGLYLDYSKNRVTDETMRLLLQLAEESHLEEHRPLPPARPSRSGRSVAGSGSRDLHAHRRAHRPIPWGSGTRPGRGRRGRACTGLWP